jgi:hypothetical protein
VVIHVYAQRRPLRVIFLVLVAIILVDFSVEDGCGCGDAYPRSVVKY